MERRLRLDRNVGWHVRSAAEVRARIARILLRPRFSDIRIGSITLHPHQRSAVARLETAIDQLGGALLCDDVGMGKTYVALAVARRFTTPLIVAPAALIDMWRAALTATGTDAEIVSFERLSRLDADECASRPAARNKRPSTSYDFVIVDEAHHVRNPRTNRYIALESIVRGAKVLLMSATPVHNRRDDLVGLLSLFLGSRARRLTSSELSLCLVRREHRQVEISARIPLVHPAVHHSLPDDPDLVQQLMSLPAPVPARDGGVAGVLIGRGLVHQWASSEAALLSALRKRIARAAALCISLEAGTYPTQEELKTWIYGDGVLQLGFPELVATPARDHRELLAGIRKHLLALEQIRDQWSTRATTRDTGGSPRGDIDTTRAEIITALRKTAPSARIVAFAQYAETISMLFRKVSRQGKAAMLTSHGGRVAGGPLSRREAISRFAPVASGCDPPPRSEEITLLLTTDLLSEGVNLQDADTVIHLDVPWTAARMEQRVGRVARLGSSYAAVKVHVLRPPPSAEKVLAGESIVSRKWLLGRSSVGTSSLDPGFTRDSTSDDPIAESLPAQAERLQSILISWLSEGRGNSTENGSANAPHQRLVDVATIAGRDGFLAAVSYGGVDQLLVGDAEQVTTSIAAQTTACVNSEGTEETTGTMEVEQALHRINAWFENTRASATAGVATSSATNRRRIVERIDLLVEGAPPHHRAALLPIAARARRLAVAPQCSAVERELESLLESELPAKEWLAAVAHLDGRQAIDESPDQELAIHAILIARATPRRSPSPRAPGSP